MSKVRINDLARELEVKSNAILDALKAVGVTEKKTHSSSMEEYEAVKGRGYFNRGSRSAAARPAAPASNAFSLKDVSKPGDALKAILERKQAEQAAKNAPPPRPAVAVVAAPGKPAVAVAPPAPGTPVVAKPAVAAAPA